MVLAAAVVLAQRLMTSRPAQVDLVVVAAVAAARQVVEVLAPSWTAITSVMPAQMITVTSQLTLDQVNSAVRFMAKFQSNAKTISLDRNKNASIQYVFVYTCSYRTINTTAQRRHAIVDNQTQRTTETRLS